MAKKQASRKKKAEPMEEIAFEYVKGNFFRVVHADGIFGGLTPHGSIHMDFWSERHPIPKRVVHTITDNGMIGPENTSKREAREAVVREVEVGVVMGIDEAKALRKWLDGKIEQATTILSQLQVENNSQTE